MTSNRKSQESTPIQERSNNRKTIIIIATTIVTTVVVMICIMKFFGLSPDNGLSQNSTEESSRNMVVMPDNVNEIISELESKKTQPGRYQVTMNTTWTFHDGSSPSSNAYVENSTANSNAVYFDIVRSDTGENIFSSPILPVGSHLKNITLDKELSAGEYACVLTYSLIDGEQKPISTLSINLNVIVEN